MCSTEGLAPMRRVMMALVMLESCVHVHVCAALRELSSGYELPPHACICKQACIDLP